jgi:hypothetical protein
MNRSQSKQSRKNKNKNKIQKMDIASSRQQYSGPILLPRASLQEDTTLANLIYYGAQTSTGTGTMNNVWGLNVSLANNYTNYTNSYDEWRLLGAELTYVPDMEDAPIPATSSTTLLGSAQVGVVDRDSSSNLTSFNAFEFASAQVKAINKEMKLSFQMSGSEDAQFITSTSASSAWFKFWATGLTNSSTYGTVFVKMLWQFRGRY